MPWSKHRFVWLFPCVACMALFAGCGANQETTSHPGTGQIPAPIVTGFAGPAVAGRVLAGNAPVQAASVQIYAAGTAGNGSAPTQLLAAALLTDTEGSFQVAAAGYQCPAADSVLYAVARGGKVASSAANSALVLVAPLGTCNQVDALTPVTLNELTTVATVYALRPFLSPGAQVGSTSSNAAGLQLALGTLGRLANLQSGTAPGAGFPANGAAPSAKLNALSNMLHACAVAATQCAALFSTMAAQGSAAPTNTLDAALSLANHPALAPPLTPSGAAPFSPSLTAAPADWTVAIPFTGGGMSGPAAVSIDAQGSVWVVNYFGVASLFANSGAPTYAAGLTGYGLQASYGGAVDPTGRLWVTNEQNDDYTINGGNGSLTLLNSSGPALPGASLLSAGGLNFPISIAFDRNGTAWVVNYGNSHLTVLNSAGIPQSGANGYSSDQLAFPVAVAADSAGNAWVANQSASTVTRVSPDGLHFTSFTVGNSPAAVAVDAADNVWTANFYGDSVGLVSPTGTVQSPGGFTGGGLSRPTGIAIDGAGRAWVANYRGAGMTALAGTADTLPGAALSGPAGWGSDLQLSESFGIAVDAAGNVWVSSYGDNRLIEFVGAAAPVKTPLLGGVRLP